MSTKSNSRKHSSLIRIVVYSLSVLIVLPLIALIYWKVANDIDRHRDYKVRNQNIQALYKEVEDINGVRVRSVEGGLSGSIYAYLLIADKEGKFPEKANASIHYSGRVTELIGIDQYDLLFPCYDTGNDPVNDDRFLIESHFKLVENSSFRNFFPFEIYTIRDLKEHYEDMIKTFQTFPRYPSNERSYEGFLKHKMLQPEYIVKIEEGQNSTECDLYFSE